MKRIFLFLLAASLLMCSFASCDNNDDVSEGNSAASENVSENGTDSSDALGDDSSGISSVDDSSADDSSDGDIQASPRFWLPKKVTRYSADGEVICGIDYTYDENGFLKTCKYTAGSRAGQELVSENVFENNILTMTMWFYGEEKYPDGRNVVVQYHFNDKGECIARSGFGTVEEPSDEIHYADESDTRSLYYRLWLDENGERYETDGDERGKFEYWLMWSLWTDEYMTHNEDGTVTIDCTVAKDGSRDVITWEPNTIMGFSQNVIFDWDYTMYKEEFGPILTCIFRA